MLCFFGAISPDLRGMRYRYSYLVLAAVDLSYYTLDEQMMRSKCELGIFLLEHVFARLLE
jgi:hypothetical protein